MRFLLLAMLAADGCPDVAEQPAPEFNCHRVLAPADAGGFARCELAWACQEQLFHIKPRAFDEECLKGRSP